MAISKAQSKAVHKYVKNHYYRISVTIPAARRSDVENRAREVSEGSVNGLINSLLRADLDISEEEWKNGDQD